MPYQTLCNRLAAGTGPKMHKVVAWVSGAIAVIAALSAALSRLMAVPWVNEQLTRIGLGTAPRDAIKVTFASGEAVGMTCRQWRPYIGADHTPPDPITEISDADTTVR